MGDTTTGTVKFFGTRTDGQYQGWGFITPDDTQNEGDGIFVYFLDIATKEADGFRTLYPNEHVEYEVVEGERGLRATNVVVLKESEQRLKHQERVAHANNAAESTA